MKNKILLIDDDQDFLEATALLLESSGYEVLSATNGLDGFQKVKDVSPDLVLLDMMMTYETEGAETAKAFALDAAVRDIPVIMITGAKRDKSFPIELKPDEHHLPVKMVLEKPVTPERLLKVVQMFIRRSGDEHRHFVGGITEIASKWKDMDGNLIMILHEIQNTYGYVPREVAFELSRILDIPLARIYEVITFYNYFKLTPPGKHLISVCIGTACYLKGGAELLQELKDVLHVNEGETTKDGQFFLQAVRCLGCCGLSPVMMIDDKIYGKVNKKDIVDILAKYE